MSEEILLALTRLFAIIVRQDGGGAEKEREFVISFFRQELDQDSLDSYVSLYDDFYEKNKKRSAKKISVSDSVRTLGICRKINKTLSQKQKVVVLIKLLELVALGEVLSGDRMEVLDTIASVFNIAQEDYSLLKKLISAKEIKNELEENPNIRFVSEFKKSSTSSLNFEIKGDLVFVKIPQVDMYFLKYIGNENLRLNSRLLKANSVYLFSHGSTLKNDKGAVIYYSDLIRLYNLGQKIPPISFNAFGISFKFGEKDTALNDINISEEQGRLIGIMGESGSGKSTLLNVLAGLEKPHSGSIKLNACDLDDPKINGLIGYVSQDDLLNEELTVYQNLYFSTKLSMSHLSEIELHEKVLSVLKSLGLEQRKDLKVGSVLDKTISGGQRKRLNIALEVIREPSLLFVDEPTSGLSSRDSEIVVDLLKELSLKGKLIFVVIHQPSSDIYKMFDKIMILDVGGYSVYYGNSVEALTYFKTEANQIDADRSQCNTCGNVNPEQIFTIIDAKVVNEYGEFTEKRKVSPSQWKDRFDKKKSLEEIEEVNSIPVNNLKLPSALKQTLIFCKRDILSKFSNKQYFYINLFEAPILAFLLSFIIRYNSSSDQSDYVFRFNDNLPVYIMMSIIVAFFMGLTISAEEIIKDRKVRKREKFLNLSWNSYLWSKFIILFSISAFQTLMFVLIGNSILEIQGMDFSYWLVLFSTACFANVLGLNISSAFNSAVTVYILIPLLIIPQMILSGLLFDFDKLNDYITNKSKVPLVADMMVSRWAYEAIATNQFVDNEYQKDLYKFEQREKEADYIASFYIKELSNMAHFANNHLHSEDSDKRNKSVLYLEVINTELRKYNYQPKMLERLLPLLSTKSYSSGAYSEVLTYFELMKNDHLEKFNVASIRKEKLKDYLDTYYSDQGGVLGLKNQYFNESLSDLLRNVSTKHRVLLYDGEMVQKIDPIFNMKSFRKHSLDYRTHFFVPIKYLFDIKIDTFVFNLLVIWLFVSILYFILYLEVLKKGVDFFFKLL